MANIEDIALTFLPGIGVKGVAHLLEVFGDAVSVYAASSDELLARTHLREEQINAIRRHKGFSEAEKELAYCHKHHIQPIASTDALYPSLLREIDDYPSVIYLQGNPEALSLRTLAVVGTRRAGNYGASVCNDWIGLMAKQISDLCIVSGLAFGIDIAAHRAALNAGVPTIGVVANALPEITPAVHSRTAREMIDQGGAILSEFTSQSRQKGYGFLARNRIIAALSRCTWIVEAPAESGALNTAHNAHRYNRPVLALPGRVNDSNSAGALHLIREGVATLSLTADDIIAELGRPETVEATKTNTGATGAVTPTAGATYPEIITVSSSPEDALSDLERKLLAYIPESDPVSMQELTLRSGIDIGTLSSLLGTLEIMGFVQHLPGNRYLKSAHYAD